MAQAIEPSGDQLSHGFEKARGVSRMLAALLGIAFWLVVVAAAAILTLMAWSMAGRPAPENVTLALGSEPIPVASLSPSGWLAIVLGLALMFLPTAFALHLGRRIFLRFARGEVFAPAAFADIRAVSLWMIVLALTSNVAMLVVNLAAGQDPRRLTFDVGLLFFGLCTYVAAYVMAEAQRIADENAGII